MGTTRPTGAPTAADAVDAYVWGYPLVVMHRTCAAHGGVGRGLIARDRLATAADRTVVAPNNDTLYASGWYDLRAGDLTVEVGAIQPDRYWSVMLLDAYTHVAYVSRRLHGKGGTTVRVTYAPEARPTGSGAAPVLAIGTPTVWALARVLVSGPDDLTAARAALDRIAVQQVPDGPTTDRIAASGDGFFAELTAALTVDPPAAWHPARPEGLDELLDDLPGSDTLDAAVRVGRARLIEAAVPDRRANGWGTRVRGADFGDDVAYRAAFARVSLAGHLPAENRSYSRPFDGSTGARLAFGPTAGPPVDGFWSLCVYDQDLFLVDNPLGRHSIGDRTPGLRRDPDGSLTIDIGHRRPARDSNWLPTPAGPCHLVLRAYEGRPDVVSADWFPPDLTTLTA